MNLMEDYLPLCVICHVAYDGTGFQAGYRQSGDTLRKLSAVRTGRMPANLEALHAGARNYRHSDERKQSIREKKLARPLVECSQCHQDVDRAHLPRHTRKYHEGGKW